MAERLTDETLTWLEKRTSDECPPQLARHYVALIGELRARRAADLTPEEREALRFARRRVCAIKFAGPVAIDDDTKAAIAVLDKLLRGGER